MVFADISCEGRIRHRAPDPRDYNEHWDSITIEEPISESLRALVRLDLEKVWQFNRELEFRENLRLEWATVDSQKMILDNLVGTVTTETARRLFNKPTAFYWLQSAQPLDANQTRTGTPKIILAAIYEEWMRAHGSIKPNIEFDHFLANPVRITPEGPQTEAEVVEAHRSLCTQASSLAGQVNDRARDWAFDIRPTNSPYYTLLPLYRAVVIIIDRYEANIARDPDGLLNLRKMASSQTVLVVRTGDEEGLSAPIRLSKLGAEPFRPQRSDVTSQELEVVRVSLAAAVRFIVDLERQEGYECSKPLEELASVDATLCKYTPKGFPRESKSTSTSWAHALLSKAEEIGIDKEPYTDLSIRRVLAGLVGEEYAPLEHEPFGHFYKLE